MKCLQGQDLFFFFFPFHSDVVRSFIHCWWVIICFGVGLAAGSVIWSCVGGRGRSYY